MSELIEYIPIYDIIDSEFSPAMRRNLLDYCGHLSPLDINVKESGERIYTFSYAEPGKSIHTYVVTRIGFRKITEVTRDGVPVTLSGHMPGYLKMIGIYKKG